MTPAWRLALRDLRGGGRGLWLLILCLFVGSAALAGIGSLSSSILGALNDQSRAMLGGDLELRVSQRRATVEELAAFAAAGHVSETVHSRTMAQRIDGSAPSLVSLKAISDAWPLVGTFTATGRRPHGREATISRALADRLGLHVGDMLRVGAAQMRIVGLIGDEPDRLGDGFNLGPTVLVDMAGLDATQVIQPGSLYESRYRLLLPPGTDGAKVGSRLQHLYPSGGWSIRTPDQAAGNLRQAMSQLGQFLLLVGLAALAIAGVGVGSGVSAYLGDKTRMIATLKVLGARSRTIAILCLMELGLVAGVGILAGLAVGAAVPAILTAIAGDALPVRPRLDLYPQPLAVAATLALLVTLLFTLPALARARSVPAAGLLRDTFGAPARPGWRLAAGIGLLLALLVTLAVLTASDRMIAFGFVGATMALVVSLWLLGLALRVLLARLPRPRRPLFRLALANLHRPGSATDRLVVALGLGFSLFVALAVIDTSLSSELRNAAPQRAPRFFAIDLQPDDAARFRAAVTGAAPGARIESMPSLRGSIVALNGMRIADMKSPPNSWLLRSDRNITWSAAIPQRNRVVAGHWWPADYQGPPLVSLEEGSARTLGLKVGDTITVAVLGVEVPARVAALRHVDWGGLGLNFAIVFAPGYIEEAPHALLATVYAPPDRDGAIAGAVAATLSSVTLVRTGDMIGQVSDMLGKVALAIRLAAAVTVAAGIVVLVGAVTASGRRRRYDNVILKLVGARRRQLLLGQAIEFLLLSLLLVGVAIAVGGIGGWYVVTRVFALPFVPDGGVVAVTLGIATGVTLVIGLLGSLPALAARPAESLRST